MQRLQRIWRQMHRLNWKKASKTLSVGIFWDDLVEMPKSLRAFTLRTMFPPISLHMVGCDLLKYQARIPRDLRPV